MSARFSAWATRAWAATRRIAGRLAPRSLAPRSLAGQLALVSLTALALAQALSFAVLRDGRAEVLATAQKGEFISRAATLARMVAALPEDLRPAALSAAETGFARFWLAGAPPAAPAAFLTRAEAELARPLANYVDFSAKLNLAPGALAAREGGPLRLDPGAAWAAPTDALWPLEAEARVLALRGRSGFGIGVRLAEGLWLTGIFAPDPPADPAVARELLAAALAAAGLAGASVLAARRIARPLRALSAAADAMGSGAPGPAAPETGPQDVARAGAAFNRMRARIEAHDAERTRLIASIGHDLRTPLTALRLRAEMAAEGDARARMLGGVAEMEAICAAMIAFARGEGEEEPMRRMDLDALAGAVCDDLADLGEPVRFHPGPRRACRCRPEAVRRALRNLVDNALRYGGGAEVRLRDAPGAVEILVEDRGPGIPPALREQACEAFFRLEGSRSRETGGAGLGLAIARGVARRHGGALVLEDAAPGLRAILRLPA